MNCSNIIFESMHEKVELADHQKVMACNFEKYVGTLLLAERLC